jgi:hypothetical protein
MRSRREREGRLRAQWREMKRAAAIAVLLAVVCGVPVAARGAGDLVGRAEFTLGMDENLAASDQYFRQVYFLQWRRQVTDALALRLAIRYQEDIGTYALDGVSSPLHTRQLAPSAMLDYRVDPFSLLLGWDRTDGSFLDSSTNLFVPQGFQRFNAQLWYRPGPWFQAWWSGNRLSSTAGASDTLDYRTSLGMIWTEGDFRLENNNRLARYESTATGIARTSLVPGLTFLFSKSQGTLYSLSARYSIEYYWQQQQTLGFALAAVPSEVQPIAGLYVVNPIPIDTTATPMVSEPRLIDGVIDVSAGFTLGPGGSSFQNFGVDMGRVITLDQLRLVVRGNEGQPVPFGGPVSWSAYVSQDGHRWIPVDGALYAFDRALSTYIVDFLPTVGRYFKIVNFGVNTVETLVTEIETFVQAGVRPAQTQTSHAVRQTLGLQGAWRPAWFLLLTYAGQFDLNAFSGYGGSPYWLNDASNGLTLKVGPFAGFTLSLTQNMVRNVQAAGFLQSSYLSMGAVDYQPFPGLLARLQAQYAIDQVAGSETSTPSVGFSGSAYPYDSMSFTAAFLASRQQILGGGVTDYVTGSAFGRLDLLRNLEFRAELAMQRTVQTRGDVSVQEEVPLFRVLNYQRSLAFLRFRPSDQLDLTAGLGYSASSGGGGLTQSYRVLWFPFPGGAIQMNLEYREEIDSFSGRSYRQFVFNPIWRVNRFAQLQLSYNVISGTGAIPMWQQSLFAMLSLSL